MKPGKEPGEDMDVRKLHGQLLREKAEPTEMYHRAPWWLKHGILLLLIWGIWYLFVGSGGFRWDEYSEGPFRTLAPPPERPLEGLATAPSLEAGLAAEGETFYATVCAACHQRDGRGLPGAFPPLAGSDWVTGDERRPALVVLHGLTGEIQVNGETWSGMMPPQGETLNDVQIAAVLTYIRSSWGNDAPPVLPASVARLREEFAGHGPWTQADLEQALD